MNALNTDLPLPVPTLLTAPFWQAAHDHRLIVQRCSHCGKFRFYPSAGCNHCASLEFTWQPVSGRGRIYSWIVVRRIVDVAWQRRTPFVSAIVELAEQPGLLMPGLLTDAAPERVQPDLPVEVWFEDMSAEISVPRWRAVRSDQGRAPG